MTPEEFPQFTNCFDALALALPLSRDQLADGGTMAAKYDVYFEALVDIPLEHIQASVRQLSRRGSGFFPSTQEWHTVADDLAYAALVAAQARPALAPAPVESTEHAKAKAARVRFLADMRSRPRGKNGLNFVQLAELFERAIPCRDPLSTPHRSWCGSCYDSGWLTRTCEDGQRCAAHRYEDREWGTHDYVERCECVAMNPTIQQRQAMRRRVK